MKASDKMRQEAVRALYRDQRRLLALLAKSEGEQVRADIETEMRRNVKRIETIEELNPDECDHKGLGGLRGLGLQELMQDTCGTRGGDQGRYYLGLGVLPGDDCAG